MLVHNFPFMNQLTKKEKKKGVYENWVSEMGSQIPTAILLSMFTYFSLNADV